MTLAGEQAGNVEISATKSTKEALHEVTRDLGELTDLSMELARRRATAAVVPDLRYLAIAAGGGVLCVAGIIQLVASAALTLAPNGVAALGWSGLALVLLSTLPLIFRNVLRGKKARRSKAARLANDDGSKSNQAIAEGTGGAGVADVTEPHTHNTAQTPRLTPLLH